MPFAFAKTSGGSDLFVVIVNDTHGYIDRTGKIVIEPKWSGAKDFSEGLAVVALGSPQYKEGYIDPTGKLVIAATFDYAGDFEDGLALVGVGEFRLHGSGDHKFGFIDKNGKWVIRPTTVQCTVFRKDLPQQWTVKANGVSSTRPARW